MSLSLSHFSTTCSLLNSELWDYILYLAALVYNPKFKTALTTK